MSSMNPTVATDRGAGPVPRGIRSDARARADHATLVALHELARQQIVILDGQNQVLEILRRAVAPKEPDPG